MDIPLYTQDELERLESIINQPNPYVITAPIKLSSLSDLDEMLILYRTFRRKRNKHSYLGNACLRDHYLTLLIIPLRDLLLLMSLLIFPVTASVINYRLSIGK